jgi:heat shock protein HspQ
MFFALPSHKLDLSAIRYDIVDMAEKISIPEVAEARFAIGEVVRHRIFDFRGVVFDIDPVFANSEDWYQSIPEGVRPSKDQPFYHLFAENAESSYIAYISQQNLLSDVEHGPISHPGINAVFDGWTGNRYELKRVLRQ